MKTNITDFEELALEAKNAGINIHVTPEYNYVFNQLFLYAIEDPSFKGDLSKGIMLLGPVGTGKTTLMKFFENIYYKFNYHVFCNDIIFKIKNGKSVYDYGRSSFANSVFPALIIDDLKNTPINVYGNVSYPIEDILYERYQYGCRTHIITNESNKRLKETFSPNIYDRIKSMVNVLTLTGESLRK